MIRVDMHLWCSGCVSRLLIQTSVVRFWRRVSQLRNWRFICLQTNRWRWKIFWWRTKYFAP